MTLTVEILFGAAQIASIREAWIASQHHPNTDLEHFLLVAEMRVDTQPVAIVVFEGNHVRALLAARLEHSYVQPRLGYLSLFKIPVCMLAVVYQGVIGSVDAAIADALIARLARFLKEGGADLVTFHHLAESAPILSSIQTGISAPWRETARAWAPHWELTLPNEPGFLLANMRSKHRGWIRRKQRDLEAAYPGKVVWEHVSAFTDISDFCSTIEQVACLTYQRGLGAGFMNDQEHRSRYALFARRGMLRACLLRIDGRARAFWIGTVYQDVFHSSVTGYDPELRDFELGTLVFLELVDKLAVEGLRKFDFGLGDAPYKERFGDHSWREASVQAYAPSAKGLILRGATASINVLDRTARLILKKFGGLQKIKTKWRKMMVQKTHDQESAKALD